MALLKASKLYRPRPIFLLFFFFYIFPVSVGIRNITWLGTKIQLCSNLCREANWGVGRWGGMQDEHACAADLREFRSLSPCFLEVLCCALARGNITTCSLRGLLVRWINKIRILRQAQDSRLKSHDLDLHPIARVWEANQRWNGDIPVWTAKNRELF